MASFTGSDSVMVIVYLRKCANLPAAGMHVPRYPTDFASNTFPLPLDFRSGYVCADLEMLINDTYTSTHHGLAFGLPLSALKYT